jgi:ribonuclease J
MTGSQGESMAALSRIARGEHQHVQLKTSDTVIFSASPIPGNTISVMHTIDKLVKLGAKVIYGKDKGIHVSGHGCQEDQKWMLALTKPKYFIPVHGEYRMQVLHGKTAVSMGVHPENVLVMENGDVAEVRPDSLIQGSPVKSGVELLDSSTLVITPRRLTLGGVITSVDESSNSTPDLTGDPCIKESGLTSATSPFSITNTFSGASPIDTAVFP